MVWAVPQFTKAERHQAEGLGSNSQRLREKLRRAQTNLTEQQHSDLSSAC